MAFDGIVTKCIVNELKNTLIGCKVNKIYEPTRQDIILNLYGNGKNFDLEICTNSNFARVNLSKHSKPNPISAPNFCMFLRKHLIGSRIIDISSFDLERIISISFEGYNELNDKVYKTLYIEIMGQFSNIVLVNESGTILDCLNHVTTKSRELLPVRPYSFPQNSKNSFIETSDFDKFYEMFSSGFNDSLDKTFSDLYIGISRRFVQYICEKHNLSLTDCSMDNLKRIYYEIKNILANVETLNFRCINILERKRLLY